MMDPAAIPSTTLLWMLSAAVLAGLPFFVIWVNAWRRRDTDHSAAPRPIHQATPPARSRDVEPQSPAPAGAAPIKPHPAPRPTAGVIEAGHVQVRVDEDGLSVSTRGFGFSTAWQPYCRLRWSTVLSLHLDTGVHDSVVALYATTRSGGSRRHVLDANALPRPEWVRLQAMIAAQTAGRIRLALQMLDRTRPFETF
jgi:hypothetical protein